MGDAVVPERLRFLLTSDVARELASVYDDQVVFPEQVVVDRPGEHNRLFPGWPSPVLVLALENQGVCAWGVPLDGAPDPPVLVGADDLDLATGEAALTVVYTASVDEYAATRRWDSVCLDPDTMLQAQAAELDSASLRFLQAEFDQGPTTAGWPGRVQYRFHRDSVRVMLWSAPGHCDWWISSPDPTALRASVAQLIDLSNLRESLWANQPDGVALVQDLRRP